MTVADADHNATYNDRRHGVHNDAALQAVLRGPPGR